jgi:hypothetical protein
MKYGTVGIYKIVSPDGKTYVGSSKNLKHRIETHFSLLKKGKHYSKSMQQQWEVNALGFQSVVLEECDDIKLTERERYWASQFPILHNIYDYIPDRNTPVDCSNGMRFETMSDAARFFGIKPSGIRHLVSTHRVGRLGVKFKLCAEEWRDVLPHYEQVAAKIKGYKHSEEARAKMRAAKVGYIPPNKGKTHRADSIQKMRESQKRIEVLDTQTGVKYKSAVEASQGSGVARTHLRRLMGRGERFVKLGEVSAKGKR